VNAVLVRPLPFPEPQRLVVVNEKNDRLHLQDFGSSVLNYLSWKAQARSFERMGAIGGGNYNLSGGGEPENLAGGHQSLLVSSTGNPTRSGPIVSR